MLPLACVRHAPQQPAEICRAGASPSTISDVMCVQACARDNEVVLRCSDSCYFCLQCIDSRIVAIGAPSTLLLAATMSVNPPCVLSVSPHPPYAFLAAPRHARSCRTAAVVCVVRSAAWPQTGTVMASRRAASTGVGIVRTRLRTSAPPNEGSKGSALTAAVATLAAASAAAAAVCYR